MFNWLGALTMGIFEHIKNLRDYTSSVMAHNHTYHITFIPQTIVTICGVDASSHCRILRWLTAEDLSQIIKSKAAPNLG